MRSSLPACFLLVAAGLVRSQSPAPPKVARWPENRQAAVALTFDDALNSQLDHAAPILKKHGLRGTFFVTTNNRAWRGRLADWQRLAAEGHEIGGHTVTHPCLLERIRPHAQDYTPQKMEADIADGARAILAATNTQRGLTFAYPCGNIGFGPPADQTRNAALFVTYVSRHFFAARTYTMSGTADPDALSILSVPDLGLTAGLEFPQLLAMMLPALQSHTAGVFTFHGIGGDYLTVSNAALDELAGYLARHAEIWTTTFGDVIRYIQESKALEIQAGESSAGSFAFSLRWPMDARIFDLPLTLTWIPPAGWTAFEAEVDGRALSVRQTGDPAGRAWLFQAAPGTRTLRFRERPGQ